MKYSLVASAIFAVSKVVAVLRTLVQPCAPLKDSIAPKPNPNTPESFSSFNFYSEVANVVVSPSGFEAVLTDANATVSSAKYM